MVATTAAAAAAWSTTGAVSAARGQSVLVCRGMASFGDCCCCRCSQSNNRSEEQSESPDVDASEAASFAVQISMVVVVVAVVVGVAAAAAINLAHMAARCLGHPLPKHREYSPRPCRSTVSHVSALE